MTADRAPIDDASSSLATDVALLDRASSVRIAMDGDIARFRIIDPLTGATFLAFRTVWVSVDGCRRLEHEFNLKDRLDSAWALKPVAFIRADDGPAILYAADAVPLGAEPPSIAGFLRLATEAADALAKLHDQNLLHGDLRPANLMRAGDGRIRLTSFGLARDLDHPDQSLGAAALNRAAPYLAPEVAGQASTQKDGADIDARSDLYALGVVFYEFLTGEQPLTALSAAEWRHAHMAIAPRPPSLLRNDVPGALDAVVLKLLAKEPCDRYWSARTLYADLRHCLDEWATKAAIAPFELGRADRVRRLARPDALHGRDVELRLLSEACLRAVRTGGAEMILLSGPAGSGKTALVHELARNVGRMSAVFALGKSDQYQSPTPYAPLVQALQSLITGLLAGTPSDLAARRAAILDLGGGQAELIAQLAPELDVVIGEHPKGPDLATGQVSSHVNRAFLGVFKTFAAQGAPLLLFLDDLQWADEATLDFVEMTVDWAPRNFVLICAYRQSERAQSERFSRILQRFAAARSMATLVALSPLRESDVAGLIAATLDEPRERVKGLARIVRDKTGGNPFYVNQLLGTLVEERVIGYDAARQQWAWDLVAIARHRQTDNIVDLLIARLARLPTPTRELLRLQAGVGAQTDASLLGPIAALPADDICNRLEPAEKAGLILRESSGWVFAHDRVQEVAYALTPESERAAQHARIAAAMLDVWRDRREGVVFAIAGQIELAVGAPIDPKLASQFSAALLSAAERATIAAARAKAIAFLTAATRILGPNRWQNDYDLARRIGVLRAECFLATADLDGAAIEIDSLFEQLTRPIDRTEAFRLKAALQTVGSDFRGATATALAGLSQLGIDLPAKPTSKNLVAAYDAVKRSLNGRSIAKIVDLPVAEDPKIEAAMALLTALEATMFFPSDGLMFLHFAVMVELTLKFGVTPAAVQGLSWFGVSVASAYDAPDEGLAYAQAAVALVDRHGYERFRAAALVALDQVSVWTKPLSFALACARDAKAAGNSSAELRWLCYSCNHIISDLLVMGECLPKILDEIEPLLAIARGAGYDDIVDLVSTQAEFVQALRQGAGKPVGSWEIAYRDDGSSAKKPMSALVFWTYLWRGEAAFLFRDFSLAARALAKAGALAWSAPAHINLSDYRLYAALTTTQSIGEPAKNPVGAQAAIDAVLEHRAQVAGWAARNPQTFGDKLALIDAEIARLRGDDFAAMKFYEAASSAAASEGFVHEQALAHELAGRHAKAVGLGTVGRHHLRLAQSCYRRWGANGKLRQLQADFPFLATELAPNRPSFMLGGEDELDFLVAMQTAQALSEEIVLDRLIETLMKNMIVHAGAQTGVLALMRGAEPRIEAIGRVVDGEVVVKIENAAPTEELIPLAILRRTVLTRKPVVSGDASAEAAPRRDAADSPRSYVCLPLLKQGALVGVLYLENNFAHKIFTSRKTAMLEVLAPQAANALEAARLYRELGEENNRRQQTEAALRSARAELARASHLSVMGELAASIGHEINQPLSGIVSSVGAGLRWLHADQPNLKEVEASLENIRNAGLRAAEIVRALRALAKQEPTVLVSVEIDALIGEILALTSAEIDKRRVNVTASLDAAGARVIADRTQLQQVILNLVINALDAMDDITTSRELVVASRLYETGVMVSVQDTGAGVPDHVATRIFDPFFTTKETGMGMGLSICRSVMEAHGGILRLAATSAAGSTFVFKLPTEPPL